MHSDKLAVVMPIFYPNPINTLENIKQFICDIDKLIIWDNTASEEKEKYAINLAQYADKIIYLTTGKNEGTAYAYNRAAEWVIMNNYNYLILMD
jgi:GT2 family glycosyltransferase